MPWMNYTPKTLYEITSDAEISSMRDRRWSSRRDHMIDKHCTVHDDDLLNSLSMEKMSEIHALLDQSEKYIEENGLSGMMTLDEFKRHMDEKLGRDFAWPAD